MVGVKTFVKGSSTLWNSGNYTFKHSILSYSDHSNDVHSFCLHQLLYIQEQNHDQIWSFSKVESNQNFNDVMIDYVMILHVHG